MKIKFRIKNAVRGPSLNCRCVPAMTLLEMVIAMAIMAIIFGAILPSFSSIHNSWASKRSSAELCQNARVLMDHLNRNLSTAVRITSVSEPGQIRGFIEFLNNDGATSRYELAESNYVKFGSDAELYDLAGPIKQLQFTCYDDEDLDTSIIDVGSIRGIRVEVLITDAAGHFEPRTFTTFIYLQANGGSGGLSIVMEDSNLRFDPTFSDDPDIERIDDTHCIGVYTGPGSDGWAVILFVDTDAGSIILEDSFEFNSQSARSPTLTKIDDGHYLCAYTGNGDAGWAVVLSVDTSTWTITKEEPLKFEARSALTPVLAKIDDSNYLCVYTGFRSRGTALILSVNPRTWHVSTGTAFEFESDSIGNPELCGIDASHYLCAYEASGLEGRALVLMPDTVTGTVSKGPDAAYVSSGSHWPVLAKIDNTNYLCAYSYRSAAGYARILTVDPVTWRVSANGDAHLFDDEQCKWPALAEINETSILCGWDGPSDAGTVAILIVDIATGKITKDHKFIFDSIGKKPALVRLDDTHYLGVYQGQGSDGTAVIFDIDPPLKP